MKSKRTKTPHPAPIAVSLRLGKGARTVVFSAALVVLLTACVFAPCLFNGFVYDDTVYVTENPAIRDLSWSGLRTLWTSFFCSSYVPLTMTSFAVDYRLFGLDPSGFHATNIAFHCLNAVLALVFVYLLSNDAVVSFIAALFFAVHPLRVESVAWVSERKDVLYAFFFLIGLISYERWRMSRRSGWYFAALTSSILSLLAKPAAVSFPLALLCVDYVQGRKIGREPFIRLLPFLAVAGMGVVITIVSQKDVIPAVIPLWMAVFLPFRGIALYLEKTVLPVHLSCLYPIPGYDTLAREGFLSILAVGACGWLVFLSRRKTKVAVFGFLFFLATLLPSLKIVPFSVNLAGDRYTYLPSIGLFFAAAAGFRRLLAWKGKCRTAVRSITIGALAGITLFFAAVSTQRCSVWKDEVTLWDDAVKSAPHAVTYNCRGIAYSWAGRFDEAIRDFTTSISLDRTCSKTFIDRADTYVRMGRFAEAIVDYTTALTIETTVKSDPTSLFRAYQNRASAYVRTGRTQEALADYEKALTLKPDDPVTLSDRGVLFLSVKEYEKAIADFNRLILRYPDTADAYYKRALCHYAMGRIAPAQEDARRARTLGYEVPARFLEKLNMRQSIE